MNVILLSGGSGRRLWPLSNDVRSKQFIKIFKKSDGTYESMVQRMYRKIREFDPFGTITIATAQSQVSALKNQLGLDIDISVEPSRKDTFPAIALAVAYLRDVKRIQGQDAVVVCPVDPYVDASYFEMLVKMERYVKSSGSKLVLMGIEPTYPSEKYGYIIPNEQGYLFKEKPPKDVAQKYMEQGAMWNAGVFAFKLQYVLEKAQEVYGFSDYNSLYKKFSVLEKISFDYAVVEQEKSIEVVPFSGEWKDLGTWNTLTEAMPENIIGYAKMNATCDNVHIVNELDIPILAMGLRDVVISASADGIIVSDKFQSSFIKPYVDEIVQPIMFAEKSWGTYQVINVQKESLTVLVTLKAGQKMNYHSHKFREELWTVIEGAGKVVLDGCLETVEVGSVISIKPEVKHTIFAETDLMKYRWEKISV